MNTYLNVYFNGKGPKPTDVVKRLSKAGFKVCIGAHDFYYRWLDEPKEEKILALADKVAKTLKGMDVNYRIKTE